MSSHALAMINTTTTPTGFAADDLADCIVTCFDCAQTCTACADACLAEDHVDMLVSCITTDLNCAAICAATGEVMSRQTAYRADISLAMLEACRIACKACAEECERHAGMHDHCRICAEACRRCEEACGRLVSAGR